MGGIESQAMRLLASTAAHRAAASDQLAAAVARCRPERLVPLLGEQRLTALLGSRAAAIAEEPLKGELLPAVREALAFNRARGLALEALAFHLTVELERAGVPVLVLKGPLLSERLHGEIGMRMVNDLDLLVAAENLEPASRALAGLGYVRASAGAETHDLHSVLEDPRGTLPRIDLHWRVHWYETAFSAAMLARSKPAADGIRRPDPDDELTALLLYYARDGFYGLRTAADMAAWWDKYGREDRDVPALERAWNDHPRLRRALAAACRVAEEVVKVPAARLLPASAQAGRRAQVAARLANPEQTGELDQLAANVELVDVLLGPADQLREFADRSLLLEPAVIAGFYGLQPSDRVRVRLLRILHVPKVLARYLFGLWGARRRTAHETSATRRSSRPLRPPGGPCA